MPDEVLRSAVEPFFTTKEPGKGSGLGLSQVYGTARQSNGAMQIESRVGVGTAVHLFLPRALRRCRSGWNRRASRRRPRRTAGASWLSTTIPACARSPRRCCGNAGSRSPRRRADRRRSTRSAQADGGVYELVVIDIAMPGLSGVETIARARRRWPELRVLYMTGYADAAGAEPGHRRRHAAEKAVSPAPSCTARCATRSNAGPGQSAAAVDIAGRRNAARAAPVRQHRIRTHGSDSNRRVEALGRATPDWPHEIWQWGMRC